MRKQTDKEKPKPTDVPAPDAPENEAPGAGPDSAGEEKPTEDKAPDDGKAKAHGEAGAEEEASPDEKLPADEVAGPTPKPQEEAPDEEQPAAAPPPAAEDDAEKAQLASDLLAARSKLAAYAAGVAPDMITDAVTLATAEAGPDADEAAVTKAMQAVLKRHPEWKTEDGKKKGGGFKLGADPDKAGGKKQGGGDAAKNVKRWNRFK